MISSNINHFSEVLFPNKMWGLDKPLIYGFLWLHIQSIAHLYWSEVRYASFRSITSEAKQSKIVDHLPNRTLLLLKVSEIYSN